MKKLLSIVMCVFVLCQAFVVVSYAQVAQTATTQLSISPLAHLSVIQGSASYTVRDTYPKDVMFWQNVNDGYLGYRPDCSNCASNGNQSPSYQHRAQFVASGTGGLLKLRFSFDDMYKVTGYRIVSRLNLDTYWNCTDVSVYIDNVLKDSFIPADITPTRVTDGSYIHNGVTVTDPTTGNEKLDYQVRNFAQSEITQTIDFAFTSTKSDKLIELYEIEIYGTKVGTYQNIALKSNGTKVSASHNQETSNGCTDHNYLILNNNNYGEEGIYILEDGTQCPRGSSHRYIANSPGSKVNMDFNFKKPYRVEYIEVVEQRTYADQIATIASNIDGTIYQTDVSMLPVTLDNPPTYRMNLGGNVVSSLRLEITPNATMDVEIREIRIFGEEVTATNALNVASYDMGGSIYASHYSPGRTDTCNCFKETTDTQGLLMDPIYAISGNYDGSISTQSCTRGDHRLTSGIASKDLSVILGFKQKSLITYLSIYELRDAFRHSNSVKVVANGETYTYDVSQYPMSYKGYSYVLTLPEPLYTDEIELIFTPDTTTTNKTIELYEIEVWGTPSTLKLEGNTITAFDASASDNVCLVIAQYTDNAKNELKLVKIVNKQQGSVNITEDISSYEHCKVFFVNSNDFTDSIVWDTIVK